MTYTGPAALCALKAGVPYVLVNGVALSETKDLLKKICEAYEGAAVPCVVLCPFFLHCAVNHRLPQKQKRSESE